MLRRALIVAAAVAVFALSAGMLFGRSDGVEAAKPQLVVDGASISGDGNGNCIVTVTWHGLHGGKPMWVNTRLTSRGQNVPDTGASTKVRSGDGQLQVVYEGVPGADGVMVSFSDNRFNLLDSTSGSGVCQLVE